MTTCYQLPTHEFMALSQHSLGNQNTEKLPTKSGAAGYDRALWKNKLINILQLYIH